MRINDIKNLNILHATEFVEILMVHVKHWVILVGQHNNTLCLSKIFRHYSPTSLLLSIKTNINYIYRDKNNIYFTQGCCLRKVSCWVKVLWRL